MTTTKELLRQRDVVYGKAWVITGMVVRLLEIDAIVKVGYFFAWVMILNKLIRALKSPLERDNWIDIAGYATLVLEDMEDVNDLPSK